MAVITSLGWTATTLLCMLILPSYVGFFIMLALGILVNTLLIGNHIAMLLAIRKHNRQLADAVSAPQQQMSVLLKREKKVAMDMFIVLVIFVICVSPKLTVTIFYQSIGSRLYNSLFLWSTTFSLLNSCINPIFYLWRCSDLRHSLRSMICD